MAASSATDSTASGTGAGAEAADRRAYQLRSLEGWGAEVRGISLSQDVPPQVVQQIKEDVTRHRLVVFRDQGVLSGQRQVEISSWFGPLESTFYKHPASPHPDVFRVSNTRKEGCTEVGRTGWHVDGSFQPAPFSHAIYHIVSCPSRGATRFMPLREVVEGLPPEQRARWERLWMVSDRRGGPVHPIIYAHSVTGLPTMCFHCGMTETLVWDYGSPTQRVAPPAETAQLLQELAAMFTHANQHLLYEHKWQPGDFIVSDNLAVAHEASPDTQLPPEKVGLRVMHRTTIAGSQPPQKPRQQPATRKRMSVT